MKLTSLLFALLLVTTGCVSPRGFPPSHGIQNFDVVDADVCRGAQPSREAIMNLGAKSIVNLRDDPLPYEEDACLKAGIEYTNIPMGGLCAPSKSTMDSVQAEIDRLPKPVFIHCRFGMERTGVTAACYQIRHGVKPEIAYKEAKGRGMSGLYLNAKSLILSYK